MLRPSIAALTLLLAACSSPAPVDPPVSSAPITQRNSIGCGVSGFEYEGVEIQSMEVSLICQNFGDVTVSEFVEVQVCRPDGLNILTIQGYTPSIASGGQAAFTISGRIDKDTDYNGSTFVIARPNGATCGATE